VNGSKIVGGDAVAMHVRFWIIHGVDAGDGWRAQRTLVLHHGAQDRAEQRGGVEHVEGDNEPDHQEDEPHQLPVDAGDEGVGRHACPHGQRPDRPTEHIDRQ
jgi:hypothetical protein